MRPSAVDAWSLEISTFVSLSVTSHLLLWARACPPDEHRPADFGAESCWSRVRGIAEYSKPTARLGTSRSPIFVSLRSCSVCSLLLEVSVVGPIDYLVDLVELSLCPVEQIALLVCQG